MPTAFETMQEVARLHSAKGKEHPVMQDYTRNGYSCYFCSFRVIQFDDITLVARTEKGEIYEITVEMS